MTLGAPWLTLVDPGRRALLPRHQPKPGQNPPIPRLPAPIPQLSQTQRTAGSQIPRGTICPRYDSREECSDGSGPLVIRDPRDARARTVETTKAHEYTRRSLSTSTQTSDGSDPCTRVPDGGLRRIALAPARGLAPPNAADRLALGPTPGNPACSLL